MHRGGKGIRGDMAKTRASPVTGMRATQEEQGRKSQGAWIFRAVPGRLYLDWGKNHLLSREATVGHFALLELQ